MTDYSIQIDEIRQAKSLEEIRGISRQFSVKATAEGGILYSRLVGNVNSEVIAIELAGKTGFPIINETPRAGFLSDRDVKLAIKDSAEKIFQAEGETMMAAEKLAVSFQYGDPKAAANSLTSLDGCLWGDASREFAASLRGDIKMVATAANMERVFGKVELTTILENPNVKTLGGQPIALLRDIAAKDGIEALLNPVQSQFIEAAPRGIYKSPDVLFNKEAPVMLSREFASAMEVDTGKFSPAANLSASGTLVRADIGMAVQVAQDEVNIARISTLREAVVAENIRRPGASVPEAFPGLAVAENAMLRPTSSRAIKVGGALGVAGLALELYDGVESVRTAQRLQGEGNATAADSELIHFGARTVGGWTGAGIGIMTGAVLGVESGPGLLVTGAIGGVAGVFAGDKIAAWNDNRGIYNQELGGKTWTYDPDNPALGWRSKAPIDYSNDDTDNARRGDLRASPATENILNYQATSRSVELVLGGAPAQRDPFSIPAEAGDTPSSRPSNWQRNAESGQWQREVYGPFVERNMTPYTTEPADAARGAQLDRQAAQIVLENAANSPASIAARYEDTYIRNGWAAHGDMPDAVRSARTSVDTLIASNGESYERQRNGRWVSDGMVLDSTANGRFHHELEATREVLQARLPPPREILPVPPMDADARLRDTVAGAYRNAGLDMSNEQVAVAATAVRATWDANALDPATTALQARPQSDGQSAIASLRLDSDDKTYVIAAVTTVDEIERARTAMTTAPHAIERTSEQSRDVREQATREANRQGLSQDAAHAAVAGLSIRGPSAGSATQTAERDIDEASPQDRRERAQTTATPSTLPPDFAPSLQQGRDLQDPQHEGHHAYREMQHKVAVFEAQQHIPHGPHSGQLAASTLQFAVENDIHYSRLSFEKNQDTGQTQLRHWEYGHKDRHFDVDLGKMASQPIEASSQRLNAALSPHYSSTTPALERTHEQRQWMSELPLNDRVLFARVRGGAPGHISDEHVMAMTVELKKIGMDATNISQVSMLGDQLRVAGAGEWGKTVMMDVSKPAPPLQDSVNAVNTLNQQQAQVLAQQQDQPTQDNQDRGPKGPKL